MFKLKFSEILNRKIRQDDIKDLAIPTWKIVEKSIIEGNSEKAIEFLNYAIFEGKQVHSNMAKFSDIMLSYIAKLCGEEEIINVFNEGHFERAKEFIKKIKTPEEALQRLVEQQRAHLSEFVVTEEADRYVVKADPCGSGGLLRRIKKVGVTKKPHNWSWNKTGIPYYCCHCCAYFEIYPIELRGYPIRIHEVTSNPNEPCIHYYYKKPELIPEEYFKRVGKKKII